MEKAQLDKLMREYYYEKNSVADTLEFLSFMFSQYDKLVMEANPIHTDLAPEKGELK